jgi:tetratricopeptide (TPR) repeat protein
MKAVVLILISISILAVCRSAEGQRKAQDSHSADSSGLANMLSHLKTQTDEAHKAGHIDEEINYRQRFSQKAWEKFAVDPTSLDKYQRYNVSFINDLPLGLLLEGTHHWPEAEAVFRHNEAELAANPVAGNDIRSENQLHLAYLLANEGKIEEAKSICSHWKGRMRHFAAGQDTAHKYGIPVAPIYDTPEVEVARWDLACGKPEEALALLAEQIAAHPHMLVPFTVLSNYYYAQGDFQKARKAESDGTTALMGR